MKAERSDAFVFFGITGDLAFKKIFPALQAMVRRGHLAMPVIGVARSRWDLAQFKARAKASIEAHGDFDPVVFEKLSALLRYVEGDYTDASTFVALREALGDAMRPLFYLAIPPSMFVAVANHLAASGCAKNARIVVEKPFGRDLASAQALNRTLLEHFPESSIFRIDHFLGKEPVQNLVYFRFANPLVEAGWNHEWIESVQITMAESFGIEGRGRFFEEAGAIRDVLQNHLLQVLACLGMECPCRKDDEAIRDERARLLKDVRTLEAADVVRGQFRGYRREPGVALDSQVETFVAAQFHIDNARWAGVPFFIRAGKRLPVTITEVLVKFKCPTPATLNFYLAPPANHYRFRINPEVVLAIGAKVKKPGELLVGEAIELLAHHQSQDVMSAYERLIGDAVIGDTALFARQDAVETSWRIVDQVLGNAAHLYEYEPGTWGPREAMTQCGPEGGWHDPRPDFTHLPGAM
ncbi:glucose-6-phosphate dehydrogenase [Oligoflexus tunisiensis]|uniref:glucose-6-phosphate dehydrogenase n=1 Tax=Oligoflexus tunisiensis TaxID=708132 RepID=UPI000B2A4BB0|nr:glucose-6-phosphate dehydrogenase [Oligoflexus tunisiensis]